MTKTIIIAIQGAPGLFYGSVKSFHPSCILSLLNILSSFLPHGLKVAASTLDILPSHHVIVVSKKDAWLCLNLWLCYEPVSMLHYIAKLTLQMWLRALKGGDFPGLSRWGQWNQKVLKSRDFPSCGQREIQCSWIWRWRSRWPLKVGKEKEMNFPLQPPEEPSPAYTMILAHWDSSDF